MEREIRLFDYSTNISLLPERFLQNSFKPNMYTDSSLPEGGGDYSLYYLFFNGVHEGAAV